MQLNRKLIYSWFVGTGLIAILGAVLIMHPEYLAGASDYSEAALAEERRIVQIGFMIMKFGGGLCFGSAIILKIMMRRFGFRIPE